MPFHFQDMCLSIVLMGAQRKFALDTAERGVVNDLSLLKVTISHDGASMFKSHKGCGILDSDLTQRFPWAMMMKVMRILWITDYFPGYAVYLAGNRSLLMRYYSNPTLTKLLNGISRSPLVRWRWTAQNLTWTSASWSWYSIQQLCRWWVGILPHKLAGISAK